MIEVDRSIVRRVRVQYRKGSESYTEVWGICFRARAMARPGSPAGDGKSPATVAAMRGRRSDATFMEIPDQGHAPLLAEADTISRIAAFVTACDPATHDGPLRHIA